MTIKLNGNVTRDKSIKPNKANMNEMDYILKKIKEVDYDLKEMNDVDCRLKKMNEMDYGLKDLNDNVIKAQVM